MRAAIISAMALGLVSAFAHAACDSPARVHSQEYRLNQAVVSVDLDGAKTNRLIARLDIDGLDYADNATAFLYFPGSVVVVFFDNGCARQYIELEASEFDNLKP